MKEYKLITGAVIIGVFVIGVVLGLYLRDPGEISDEIDINPIPSHCLYNGETYNSGETFPAIDGCNNCECRDGSITCTLKACE